MLDVDNVSMAQQPQQLDLPQDPDCVCHTFKDVGYSFDGHLFSSEIVDGRGHDTIGSLANDLLDGVPVGLAVLCGLEEGSNELDDLWAG